MKYRVSELDFAPPPKVTVHKPSIAIGLPLWSLSWPRKFPSELNALIRPSAEIADENVAAEAAKGERCPRDAPGRVQRSARRKPPQQMTVGVKNIDKAIARTRHVVMHLRVLQGVGHEQIAVDVLDAEWREAGRDVRIHEAAIGGHREIKAGGAAGGGGAVDFDRSGAEVGGKKEDTVDVDPENETFVNGAATAFGTVELLTARTALSGGVRPPVQADIVPSSVAQMNARPARASSRNQECRGYVRGRVPHHAGRAARGSVWRATRSLPGGRRAGDRDNQGHDRAVAIIKCRQSVGVVGDPERARGRSKSHSPRILQVRINHLTARAWKSERSVVTT